MIKYIAQRVLALLITLFIILTIAFLVIRLMPGSIYDSNEMLSADMAPWVQATRYPSWSTKKLTGSTLTP